MRDLKWWHWVLIAFVAISVINGLISGPKPKHAEPSVAKVIEAPLAPAKVRVIGKSIFAITIDPRMPATSLPSFARDRCDGAAQCMVFVWADQSRVARGFPLTDREVDAVVYQYNLNRLSGFERSLWDCRRYQKVDRSSCMSH